MSFLKPFMEAAGFKTYVDLEKAIGMSHSDLWRIRKGGECRISTLKKIAEALDISVAELLDGQARALQQPREEKPYCCPVCLGQQEVPLYLGPGTDATMIPCRPCGGTGILWR